jgi:hypothetical protein
VADRGVTREYEALFPDDVPQPIRDEAKRLLGMTIGSKIGRQFMDRADFGECLYFLAVLTDDPRWDFLRGG